ncbi:MAG: Ku protein [Solirubrobacterales bacterium]
MALRSIWNGTISFGLVKVPIKLYSATESKVIRFREVHLKDASPLEHRRICAVEEIEVDYKDIVKGYEIEQDEYVVLDPDEIKAAAGDRGKILDIEEFVDAAEIDPAYFNRTYFAGFRDDPEPYAVFERALEKSGKAGIGRFSFHNREYLVAVRSRQDLLTVHTLHFEDEMVYGRNLKVQSPSKSPSDKEVKMARSLIKGLHEPFDANDFQDEHRNAVRSLIEDKMKGKKRRGGSKTEKPGQDDLSAALEASLDARKAKAKKS